MIFFLYDLALLFVLEIIMVFVVPKGMFALDEKEIHLGKLWVINILLFTMNAFAVSFACLHMMNVNN